MADLKAFAEQLVNLTVKEVNELAQILKDEYGIEPAAAAVAVAAPAAGGGDDAPAAEAAQLAAECAASRRLGPVRNRDSPFGSQAACGVVAVDEQRAIGMAHVIQIGR